MSETPGPVARKMEQALREALSPTHLEIIDESARHAHHAGGNPEHGESHFHVVIVSPAFSGASLVQRHRMVNEALDDLLKARVHALRITARAPEEQAP